MSKFVKQCRREWKRLRVSDAVAHEMAADLTADLEEAQAEGASIEDVLGSSAFDPRSFAASWAAARGVTRPSPTPGGPPPRSLVRATLAASGIALIGAVMLILPISSGHRVAVLAARSSRPAPPGILATHGEVRAAADMHALGVLLVIVGIAAIVATLAWIRWTRAGGRSPWSSFVREGTGASGPR